MKNSVGMKSQHPEPLFRCLATNFIFCYAYLIFLYLQNVYSLV